MDAHLAALAAAQADIVAAWQLRDVGWSWGKIQHHIRRRGWRRIHSGVYALTSSPLSRRQLWFAAVLTAPGTVLSHGSGGACYGFYRFERGYEVVTRAGTSGRRRSGGVLICRSRLLEGDVTRFTGIPITTAERVLVDLAPGLDERRLGRAFREALRLKRTTAGRVLDCGLRHQGRPGTPLLRSFAVRYARLPYDRTRSDAEALGLERLHDAGRPMPLVNAKVEGGEADFTWRDTKPMVIVEIDGPQYHQFRDEDERKAARWRRAGYDVRRISSDAVYDAPDEFLALCPL